MKSVLLFVPTNRYGGLDILFSSLDRQTYPFTLCMADELWDKRVFAYEAGGYLDNTIFVDCKVQPGNQRALAQAYNNAADLAVDLNFDLLVSLQDYIWIQDDGVEKFVEVHKKYPDSLLTGLVSLSDAPSDQDIADRSGGYTIFREPLTERPSGISWQDVRGTDLYPGEPDIQPCAAEHWEANWAAIPVSILKEGIRWNLEYDEGVAYENQDFAKRAETELGTSCVLDKSNVAVGIPHREIWPEEKIQLERYNNRWMHEARYGKLE